MGIPALLAFVALALPDQPPRTFLDEAGAVPLKPDLCLPDNQRVTWVGDARYRRLPEVAYRSADLYQLLAYAVALDLSGGTLIYATEEGVSAAEHVVVRAGKRLCVVALDLMAPPAAILRQVKAIAHRVSPPSALRASFVPHGIWPSASAAS